MNKDDIIRMAREADVWVVEQEPYQTQLERFAAVVAAAVEERLKWDGLHSCHPECDRPACVHTRKAVEAEREACAKLCEEIDAEYEGEDVLATWCAAAIRARGQQ